MAEQWLSMTGHPVFCYMAIWREVGLDNSLLKLLFVLTLKWRVLIYDVSEGLFHIGINQYGLI